MWTDGTFVSFDTETTGVDPETARIVTASVVIIRPGHQPEVHEWLANPGMEIPEEAASVHGITTERARAEGRPAVEVVNEVAALIDQQWTATTPLIVYNASYDLTLLDREVRRHLGRAWYGPALPVPVIDPLVLDRALDKYRKGSRKLIDVSRHYGVPISEEDAHGSTADALCAARVAWVIGKRFPDECGDLWKLQDHQRRWHQDWADHFGEYLTKQGKPDDVDRHWPIRPMPVGVSA